MVYGLSIEEQHAFILKKEVWKNCVFKRTSGNDPMFMGRPAS